MIYIGIDPGVSGGIASVTTSGSVLSYCGMPATDKDVLAALRTITGQQDVEGRAHALLERVSASPQMGVVSAFTFGRGFGGLRMALAALEIPFDEVAPAKWQTLMGCRTGGDKNISKRRAQALFPWVSVTHAIADALLLAECCRRVRIVLDADQRPQPGETHGQESRTQGPQEGHKEVKAGPQEVRRQEAEPRRRRARPGRTDA